ncbi:MAG: hypothetical protein K5829_02255 [Treponema sp.]|nr:hypothetical protein [Treponema sp.]
MKKFTAIVVSLLMACALFAQSGSKKLISGVYNFATEESDSWTIYEPVFKSVDPIAEKFVFKGAFIIKALIGTSKYDFTCTIAKQNEDFNVSLTDMCFYACDKNLKILRTGKKYKVGDKLANEYAKQMKEEILKRMSNWSDEEYEEKFNNAITAPTILSCIANNSSLVFKKFIKDNEIIGRHIKTKIYVTKVDEAPSYAEGYSYYVAGNALKGYKTDEFGLKFPEYVSIMVYTNNDDVISLTPAELMDGILAGGTSGSEYEVAGTIRDLSQKSIGGLSVIEVNE